MARKVRLSEVINKHCVPEGAMALNAFSSLKELAVRFPAVADALTEDAERRSMPISDVVDTKTGDVTKRGALTMARMCLAEKLGLGEGAPDGELEQLVERAEEAARVAENAASRAETAARRVEQAGAGG